MHVLSIAVPRSKSATIVGRHICVKGDCEMNLHNLFSLAGIATEIAIVALLCYRRAWRTLPVFCVYCIWALFSDAAALALTLFWPERYGFNFYAASTFVDFAMQLSVIVELAWSVLRPIRGGLSARALCGVAALILAVGALVWPLASVSGIALPSNGWRIVVQMQQTVSILRVLFFLLLAGCSHVLSLGWRDRELQVATGFGFYSLVSLGVAAVNSHLATETQFLNLYWLVAISFLGSLLYWVFSFAQQEAARREFTPQAKEILLALAKSAHVARVQLAEFTAAKQVSRNPC